MTSKIEWTDETWNPIIGCSHCSTGCDNCYAERMAWRLANMENENAVFYQGVVTDKGKWNGRTVFIPDRLNIPAKWRRPRRVFVCSMGDIFHESISNNQIDRVFNAAFKAPQHTYVILTKRPLRMQQYFKSCRERGVPVLLWERNELKLWKGVTICNQKEADEKIPILLQIPAAVRWVSIEPMLGPVDLRELRCPYDWDIDLLDTPDPSCRLHWTVCGCETGPGARPMELQWARNILAQCKSAGVQFFIKQIDSAKSPIPDDLMVREYPEV